MKFQIRFGAPEYGFFVYPRAPKPGLWFQMEDMFGLRSRYCTLLDFFLICLCSYKFAERVKLWSREAHIKWIPGFLIGSTWNCPIICILIFYRFPAGGPFLKIVPHFKAVIEGKEDFDLNLIHLLIANSLRFPAPPPTAFIPQSGARRTNVDLGVMNPLSPASGVAHMSINTRPVQSAIQLQV